MQAEKTKNYSISKNEQKNQIVKPRNKIQLLSPAGNFDALVAAVQNGADAVYLGSKLFNARKLAGNFQENELKKAVQYAHLHGVKIYLTLNTLIKNNEITAFLQQVSLAAQINIDAIILQDLSFAPLIKETFPELEIHASTQATIMNSVAVDYWKKYVSVFVLARELSKKEVSEIHNKTNAKLETFVHGHLCISYSGQCLISSLIGKRSGNRGLCASSCRKQYNGDQYLISAKDLCMINNIKDAAEAGISTVKIEGRMKSAEYVAITTKAYREQIDNYFAKSSANIHQSASPQTIHNLAMAFSRSFTQGYFNDEKSIVDATHSSKRGVLLGFVRFGWMELESDLSIHDGVGIVYHGKASGDYVRKIILRSRDGNTEEVQSAKKGNKVKLLVQGFNDMAKVYLMSQQHGKDVLGDIAKAGFSLEIDIKENQNVTAYIIINGQKISYSFDIAAVKPQKYPLIKEQLEKEFEKYTSEIFFINKIRISTDNSFFPLSLITKFRANVDTILLDFLYPAKDFCEIAKIFKLENLENMDNSGNIGNSDTVNNFSDGKIHVRVYTFDGVKEAADAGSDIIYYDAFAADVIAVKKYLQEKSIKFYLHTPMMMVDRDIETLYKIIEKIKPDGILANNIGVLGMNLQIPVVLGYQMNIFNDQQLKYYNPKAAVVSLELNIKEIATFKQKEKLIYYAHGYPVVMTFKEDFQETSLTDNKQYTFQLRKDREDSRENKTGTAATEMLYSRRIALLQHTPTIIAAGVKQLFLDLNEEVYEVVSLYKRLLEGKKTAVKEFQKNATVGNLMKGVM